MLNTKYYTLLAGNPEAWDQETRDRCRPGHVPGTYESEDLCRVQVEQHARGRRSATIFQTIFGWSVQYGSNLDGRATLFGGRSRPNTTKQEAIDFGIAWANEAPAYREFYVAKDHLPV